MTWFLPIVALMAAIALLWIMPVLLRRNAADSTAATASNLAILRDQIAELQRDVASGTLSQQNHELARQDLERRVIEDTSGEATGGSPIPSADGRRTALVLALAIPLFAVLLYVQLGNPGALTVTPRSGPGHNITAQDVEAMVAQLAARLEQKPDDGNGWALLGRSYVAMQRYDNAVRAYERAAALIKDDANLLADYADALAMTQDRRINGKALQLVEQALRVDAKNWKALAMAGTAAFERKDYKKSIDYWEKVRQSAEVHPEVVQAIEANIAEARELGNMKPGTAAAVSAPRATTTTSATSSQSAQVATAAPSAPAGRASVQGNVKLSPALAGKAGPSDTVFIYARAAQGSRMPLAIVRRQVKDLPFTFSLDDSQAMAPGMNLSSVGEVVIGARVSKSANAVPQSGDLQGASTTVKVGASGISVVIDSVVP